MDRSFEGSPAFAKMLTGMPEPDLACIALEIARDSSPEIDIEHYLGWIDDLARRIQDRCPPSMEQIRILGQINWALHVEEGFRGNNEDYYDARNSYLNEVIDRKLGIPITLCILYGAVASRVGLKLAGVDLPAHFMLKFETLHGIQFIDPFYGVILNQSGCEKRLTDILEQPVQLTPKQIEDCPPARIIARMLRNLKAIHLGAGDVFGALTVQRRLTAIFPDDPQEQRDLGIFCLQLGKLDDGAAALQEYLRQHPNTADASFIESLIRDARREIILRN